MKAQVLSVQYDFGGYEAGSHPKNGRKIASLMNVELRVGGKREFARVDRFFKERLGRLTQNRRKQIFDTMPAEVKLEIVKTVKKDKHLYAIVSGDLEQWLQRIEKG